MAHYLAMVENRMKKLDEWVIRQMLREENGKTDALAWITAILPIKEAMILPVYLKAGLSVIPKPVCNTNQTDSG